MPYYTEDPKGTIILTTTHIVVCTGVQVRGRPRAHALDCGRSGRPLNHFDTFHRFMHEYPGSQLRATLTIYIELLHSPYIYIYGSSEKEKSSRYTSSHRCSITWHTSTGFCDTRRPPLVVTAEPHMLQSSSGINIQVHASISLCHIHLLVF